MKVSSKCKVLGESIQQKSYDVAFLELYIVVLIEMEKFQ